MKSVVAGLSLLALMASSANAAQVMRCSHQLPPSHHIAIVVDRWAAEVERLSEGEIDVEVYGADSLVKANANIAEVTAGRIECAFSLNFQWSQILPLMDVTVGPYTASSIEVWEKWPGSEAALFLERKLEEKGVKTVAWLFQTNTSVFTSNGKPLLAPADFQGLKMRGIAPPFDAGLIAMGASTVTMPGSELYGALADGTVDAAVTDVAAAWSRELYEVQDHMTVVPALAATLHGYVNPAWYAGLSDKAKAALHDAGEEAARWAIEASQKAAAAAPQQLRGQGVTVHIATEAENEAFRAAMQPAFNEAFAEQTGEDGRTLLRLVDSLR